MLKLPALLIITQLLSYCEPSKPAAPAAPAEPAHDPARCAMPTRAYPEWCNTIPKDRIQPKGNAKDAP
jgi:hypothetical protein